MSIVIRVFRHALLEQVHSTIALSCLLDRDEVCVDVCI